MNTTVENINLQEISTEIFKVLTTKEQDVVTQRFNLDGKGKRTLESVGQQYAVTRERIRQIENVALAKLRRTMKNTQIKPVVDLAHQILKKHGGLLTENQLVSKIITEIGQSSETDGNFVRVALSVDSETHQIFDRARVRRCWAFQDINKQLILKIGSAAVSLLKTNKGAIKPADLIPQVANFLQEKSKLNVESDLISSALEVDLRLAALDGHFGLFEDRTVRPRALRDKAYIVLKRHGQPMHFSEITNAIIAAGFDQKPVRTPAVHNELIRSENFVLVGRGLYGLREWGRQGGIVPDVIARILQEAKKPLTRDEVIERVQAEREVKEGTIILNLQKHPHSQKNTDGTWSWKK